jgi:hypothetical protein
LDCISNPFTGIAPEPHTESVCTASQEPPLVHLKLVQLLSILLILSFPAVVNSENVLSVGVPPTHDLDIHSFA